MSTYLFPGQGSQILGMGKDLFTHFPEEVKQADKILAYSIIDLCLQDTSNRLSNTLYTQPALYVVEALSFLLKKNTQQAANYYAGHSLGEYSALFAAGAFDFKTGLLLVKKRGELMAQATGGGMLAVINLSALRITELLTENRLQSIDFANFNSPKQIVLSGPANDIVLASQILSPEATMCVPLRVSGAFHSRYMQTAADEFERYIAPFNFQSLQTPVIANVTASPYNDNSIKENLVKQIVSPVLWSKTIAYLKEQGENDFQEIGPGNVLTRLMAQN